MRNTRFDTYPGLRLPREYQKMRMNKVIREELTQLQRRTLHDYYFRHLTIPEIARERGVNKSTVCRTLKRAEARIRRFLQY